ncbi:hypothetical protein SLA2020_437450 [Shorea laevis]
MGETGPSPDRNRKLTEMSAGRVVWKIEEEEVEERVEENETEYELEDLRDRIKSSRGSRFNLITNELGLESLAGSSVARASSLASETSLKA